MNSLATDATLGRVGLIATLFLAPIPALASAPQAITAWSFSHRTGIREILTVLAMGLSDQQHCVKPWA